MKNSTFNGAYHFYAWVNWMGEFIYLLETPIRILAIAIFHDANALICRLSILREILAESENKRKTNDYKQTKYGEIDNIITKYLKKSKSKPFSWEFCFPCRFLFYCNHKFSVRNNFQLKWRIYSKKMIKLM